MPMHKNAHALDAWPQNFVFVSVSDLRPLGRGQTHVLPMGHIAMEEFFTWQQNIHGEVGSLGPGWNMEANEKGAQRLNPGSLLLTLPHLSSKSCVCAGLEPARHGDPFKDKGGHKGIPTMVRDYFASHKESSIVGPDGKRVPKPVPLTLGPGDACIGNCHQQRIAYVRSVLLHCYIGRWCGLQQTSPFRTLAQGMTLARRESRPSFVSSSQG